MSENVENAILEILEMLDFINAHGGFTEYNDYSDLHDAVSLIPCNDWISVDDALPEPYTQVIVTWVNHRPAPYYMQIKDKQFVSTAVWYCGSWYWWNERIEDLLAEYGERGGEPVDSAIEITHWMPLPESPEMEVNDDKR